MTLDYYVLAAIMGMAVATYVTRAGGYMLFRAFGMPPFVRAALRYLPGALFVSYVAPALVAGHAEHWFGAVATVAIMVATRRLTVAILGGTAAAWLAEIVI